MDPLASWFAYEREVLARAGVQEIGAPFTGPHGSPSCHFVHRGTPFLVTEVHHGRGRLPIYGVLDARSAPPAPTELAQLPFARLRRRTKLDGTGVALGLNADTPTGDAAFDERVYLESVAPLADRLTLVRAPEARSAVVQLLADEATHDVRIGELGCLAVLGTKRVGGERLLGQLDALGRLARAMPRADAPVATHQGRVWAELEVAAVVLLGVMGWLPAILTAETRSPYAGPFGIVVLLLAGGLGAVGMLVQGWRHRGTTHGLRMVTWNLFALAFACPFLVMFGVQELNQALPSPERTRRARVEDHRCSTSKGKTQCWLSVRTLDDDTVHRLSGEAVAGFRSIEDPAVVGNCGPATLVDRAGGLGFPILVSLRRTPNGAEYVTPCASE